VIAVGRMVLMWVFFYASSGEWGALKVLVGTRRLGLSLYAVVACMCRKRVFSF
jgi:hypothetical protein